MIGVVTMADRLQRHAALATSHQRLYVRTLLRQLELDTQVITTFHLRFFRDAGLPPPTPGDHIDPLLCALTKTRISALASAFKKEVPDE